MARYVEFNIPAASKKKNKAKRRAETFHRGYGESLVLTISGVTIRFVIQSKIDGEDCFKRLVHFDSGFIVSKDIEAEKLMFMCTIGTTRKYTDRQAAFSILHRLIERLSFEYFTEKLALAPVINP